MTTFEIAFNILGVSGTLAGLFYVRHLLRTAGRDGLSDPELVKRFRRTAPYHRLAEVMRE